MTWCLYEINNMFTVPFAFSGYLFNILSMQLKDTIAQIGWKVGYLVVSVLAYSLLTVWEVHRWYPLVIQISWYLLSKMPLTILPGPHFRTSLVLAKQKKMYDMSLCPVLWWNISKAVVKHSQFVFLLCEPIGLTTSMSSVFTVIYNASGCCHAAIRRLHGLNYARILVTK